MHEITPACSDRQWVSELRAHCSQTAFGCGADGQSCHKFLIFLESRNARGSYIKTGSSSLDHCFLMAGQYEIKSLRVRLAAETIDVVAITESWIHRDIRKFSVEYLFTGYSMMHKDRTRHKGGSVWIYVKDSLNCVRCNVQSDYELIGTDLKYGSATYRLLLVYR